MERETGRTFTTHTKNIFVETRLLTVSSEEAEEDHALIEGLYAKVEAIAGRPALVSAHAPNSMPSSRRTGGSA